MITTIEVKKEYKCDLCGTTQIGTDEMPTGWIVVHGFEADDSRPSPTMHLCPSCTVRTYRAITKDRIVREMIEQTSQDMLINNDCIAYRLAQITPKPERAEEHKDANSIKNKLIEASHVIEGYFDCLADDGFPITPWSDAIVCIPADTKHYEYDLELEEFKENGEYTNYACLVKVKSIMQKNGIIWGSIANGAPDELTWFNLTRIKDSFTISDTIRAEDCLYKISDDIVEPLYVETYYYDPKFHEFFNSEKNDMGGLKNITITATSIAKIEDSPVALVKIRCRDDEDFTGKWIKFSDLVKMD